MAWRFERSGRRPAAAVALAAVWAALLAAWLWLGAAEWVLLPFLVLSLPAAWDLVTGRQAGLEIDHCAMRWWSGGHRGEARLSAIDHVRLERRFDLSLRARLVLPDGRRVTLPQDSLPPLATLESALAEAGLRSERHPFSLL